MCGIAGILNLRPGPPASIEELSAMIATVGHRGPDERGVYRDEHVGLAHARLSIIDLALGQQPLAAPGGSTWVTYNGEIYNHIELRAELEKRGRRFATRSDTEVLAVAYETWGDAFVERFEGQFAFALWDVARRRLVLARDRVGVRPLYMTTVGGRLLFASEIKALFQIPEVPRAIDPLGLDEVFTFWTPVAPRTAFAGISELAPGRLLSIDAGGTRERVHYEPRFRAQHAPGPPPSLESSADALEQALARATALRLLRADVPVGCYLSGGLDSSVVAALARRAHSGTLRTFSVRFEDAEFDEGRYQRAMVDRLETEHSEVYVTRRDIAACFPDVIRHAERPILRTAPAPLYLLSRLVHEEGIKVVLTGEGADEMLAGYDLFREAKVRRFWAQQPDSEFRPLLFDRLYPWMARSPQKAREMARSFFGMGLDQPGAPDFSHRPRFRAAKALGRLFSPGVREAIGSRDAVAELCASLPEDFATWGPLSRAQYLEIRTLLSGYLLSAQGDRVAMAHSVEGRFPFLDGEVMAVAHAMPETHKLHVLDEKHVLKRIAARLVPASILARPKQPYRSPDAASFFGAGAPEYVEALLSEHALAEAGLFEPTGVARLAAKCRVAASGPPLANADNMALVGVLSAQLVWFELVAAPPPRPVLAPLTTLVDRAGARPQR